MKSISLVPEEAKGIRGVIVPNNILIFLAVSLIAFMGLGYYLYSQNNNVAEAQRSLESKSTENLQLVQEVEKLKKRKIAQVDTNLEESISTINTITKSRTNWVKYVNKFNALASNYNVRLTGIQLASGGGNDAAPAPSASGATGSAGGVPSGGGGNITLTGVGANQKIVSRFVQGLRDDLKLKDLDVTLTGVPTKTGRGLSFTISVNYPIPSTQGVPASGGGEAAAATGGNTTAPATPSPPPANTVAPTAATGGGQ